MQETRDRSPRDPLRVVITGSPGAGKTTTVDLLAGWGWSTMPEEARRLIQAEQAAAGVVFPWTRLAEFVERLAQAQEQQWLAAQECSGPVFFDRGIPDACAFLRHHRTRASPAYEQACRRYRYTLVFDLMPLDGYVRDAQRPYTQAEALILAEWNREAYLRLGYDLIPVPTMPPEARACHILEELKRRVGPSFPVDKVPTEKSDVFRREVP